MGICALCLKEERLVASHLIPAFVFRWLKETGATGFLRGGTNVNLRMQDGKKHDLLCIQCEGVLNNYETNFANMIFYPYVNQELSDSGIATGKIGSFIYTDWLLRFVISIHWRLIVTHDAPTDKHIPQKLLTCLNNMRETWRKFLLKESDHTGDCESHIIFLRNLAAGQGTLPPNINDNINFYLLRAVDGTSISSRNKIGVYSKVGPIAFMTTIRPNKFVNAVDTRIRMKGKIKTAQVIKNQLIAKFVFITRPNEAFSKAKYSEKQLQVIENAYKANPEKAKRSMTMRAAEADLILKHKKGKFYEPEG
jgi:hypothetical protein